LSTLLRHLHRCAKCFSPGAISSSAARDGDRRFAVGDGGGFGVREVRGATSGPALHGREAVSARRKKEIRAFRFMWA
jgi:hypothetical protein